MFGLNMKPFFLLPPLLISLLITPVITEQPETSKVILTGIFVIWWRLVSFLEGQWRSQQKIYCSILFLEIKETKKKILTFSLSVCYFINSLVADVGTTSFSGRRSLAQCLKMIQKCLIECLDEIFLEIFKHCAKIVFVCTYQAEYSSFLLCWE